MGLFSFKNKNDIVPKEKDLKAVVSRFNSVNGVKINAKLVVPNGYMFVIGKKGKVADCFETGEHYFNFSNLPIMCRKFHIDDDRKNKGKKEFSADLYFVKKDICAGKFETYRKVDMGTKAYGVFSTKVSGVYSYKVVDVKEFLQSLLNEFDYIKTGEAETILESWVSEMVVKELESQNFLLQDVIENKPIIADTLKLKLSKLFSVAGLELLELKITKYKLPKKYQKESDENILRQNQTKIEELNEKADNYLVEKNTDENEEKEKIEIKESIENVQDIKKQEYYEIENIDNDILDAKELLGEFTEKENKQEISKEQININSDKNCKNEVLEELATKSEDETVKAQNEQEIDTNLSNYNAKEDFEYKPFGSFKFDSYSNVKNNEEKPKKQKTFVDLSLNELYTNTENTKRCLNCGTENNLDAKHCLLCGEIFNKGEEI